MGNIDYRRMETHVNVLGWLNIAAGILLIFGGIAAFFFLAGIGLASGDADALPILGIMGTMFGGFMGMMAIPSLLAGYGLLKRRNWGRILTIVMAVFHVMNFPFGTALGVYSFYVLFQSEATDYFMPLKAG